MVSPEAGESVVVCLLCLRKLLPEHERHIYGWEQAISDNHIKSCCMFITIIIHYCLLFFINSEPQYIAFLYELSQ